MNATGPWDGSTFGADALRSDDPQAVLGWLRGQLSSALDPRYGENPDAAVVGLLRRLGEDHASFGAVALAVRAILEEAVPDAVPTSTHRTPYFGALRICHQVRMPHVAAWFEREVASLAGVDAPGIDLGPREARLGGAGGADLAMEFAYAAAVQVPSRVSPKSRAAWDRLLGEPRYATIALLASSSSFDEIVQRMGTWWGACGTDERGRELEQILRSALRGKGERKVRAAVAASSDELPPDLREAIDATVERILAGDGRPARGGGLER